MHRNWLECSNLQLPQIKVSYIHKCKWEIHLRICQGFHKIRCHGAPVW